MMSGERKNIIQIKILCQEVNRKYFRQKLIYVQTQVDEEEEERDIIQYLNSPVI